MTSSFGPVATTRSTGPPCATSVFNVRLHRKEPAGSSFATNPQVASATQVDESGPNERASLKVPPTMTLPIESTATESTVELPGVVAE